MNLRAPSRTAAAVLLALACALAGGCLKIDSTLDINADGSGKWRLVYAMPTHMIRQVQASASLATALRQAAGQTNAVAAPLDIPLLFDETVIRNRFAPLEAQGIRLTKLELRPRAGWPTVELTVQFDSLEALLRQPFFDDMAAVYRREADGTGRLVITAPQAGATAAPPDLNDPRISGPVVPFLTGLNIVTRIGVPGALRNTNAKANDARRATWEWDFERDGGALERLNSARMVVVFDAAATSMKPFEKAARPPIH